MKVVSIIIPTKNAEGHLKLLIPSIESQTYKNIEVIVNDDKRTVDNTRQLISSYKDKLNIKYLNLNKSMAQGRKSGAEKAKGEYLLHLDADMVLSPEVVEQSVDQIKKGYDALVIPEISFGEGFWAKVRAFERSMYIGDETMESLRFIKADIYKKLNGHDEAMVLSEDKDFDLRVRATGFKVGRINAPIYHNEGKLSLWRDMQKKFFYGKTAHVFINPHPGHSVKQANLLFRPAYFRNWKKLLSNPHLAVGMFIMKFLEMFAAFCGLMYVTIAPSQKIQSK